MSTWKRCGVFEYQTCISVVDLPGGRAMFSYGFLPRPEECDCNLIVLVVLFMYTVCDSSLSHELLAYICI